jgi:RecJ-like exonuclease
MFCSNCSKLTYVQITKNCLRCNENVDNSISVICDECSTNEASCSSCLKKIKYLDFKTNIIDSGKCGGCGS